MVENKIHLGVVVITWMVENKIDLDAVVMALLAYLVELPGTTLARIELFSFVGDQCKTVRPLSFFLDYHQQIS